MPFSRTPRIIRDLGFKTSRFRKIPSFKMKTLLGAWDSPSGPPRFLPNFTEGVLSHYNWGFSNLLGELFFCFHPSSPLLEKLGGSSLVGLLPAGVYSPSVPTEGFLNPLFWGGASISSRCVLVACPTFL